MEKLPMCRVCLAENVRMFKVVNKNLRDLYEKLTDNPFVTDDSRPMLTCFFCCNKLKQCYQFQRKCLEAEEQFAQMENQGIPLIIQDHSESCNGLIQSSVELISIAGESQTENIVIKEELPDVLEILDDNIEPQKEHQSDDLELEHQENNFLDIEDIPTQHSESDSEDDESIMEFKIDVEEHEVSRNKRRASDSQRASIAKKPKLEDVIKEEQETNEQSNTRVIRAAENCTLNTANFKDPSTDTNPGIHHFKFDANCRNKAVIKCEKINKATIDDLINRHQRLLAKENPFKCAICQSCFSKKAYLISHIRTHGEKPYKCDTCQHGFTLKSNLKRHILTHTGEKPYKCNICQHGFTLKGNLKRHIRMHTGENPYECVVCQHCFSDKASLISHICTNTGEKPYKCDICLRSFANKSHLSNHMRTHSSTYIGKQPIHHSPLFR